MSNILTYAIGDIHGRLDLLDRLLEKIKADAQGRDYRLVFLGDYVDRGPASKQVIDRLIALEKMDWKNPPVFLMGNHEDEMSRVLFNEYDWDIFNKWMFYGGTSTIESYSVKLKFGEANGRSLCNAFQETVSSPQKDFLKSLKLNFQTSGFFFCHAGIDFNRSLSDQKRNDLLWIRKSFTESEMTSDKVVIHGHTITENFAPELRRNRIGIDTGAYKSENLTACAVQGDQVCGFIMTLEA